jgi:hypothetical protein
MASLSLLFHTCPHTNFNPQNVVTSSPQARLNMSFHQSCRNIHIKEKDGYTMLSAEVRDTQGKYHDRRIRLDDHIGNTDGITPTSSFLHSPTVVYY